MQVVQRCLDVLDRDCVRATSTRVGRVVVYDEGRRSRPLLLLYITRREVLGWRRTARDMGEESGGGVHGGCAYRRRAAGG